MRRNDHDVTDSVRTTDPASVAAEVIRLGGRLFADPPARELERAFGDAAELYLGRHPDYCACDTEYHDIQHVLDVTLAMARLMDGYQRSRGAAEAPLTRELYAVGALAALFHDFGYLRRRNDHRHRYGAEYTLVHVSRGAGFLRRYAGRLGLGEELSRLAATLVHFTGYERPVDAIRIRSALARRIGQLLGTADILAQMSDRCYLEKCRDRLYPEFVLGRLAGRGRSLARTLPEFASGEDLVHRTPAFYSGASQRLNLQLARSYELATHHFGGVNPYLDAIEKNVRHAARIADHPDPGRLLRRRAPSTLAPEARPYPMDLVGL